MSFQEECVNEVGRSDNADTPMTVKGVQVGRLFAMRLHELRERG